MGCGCADRMRRLLRRHGYEFDAETGVWEHPETGSRFTDRYVERNHARLLVRFAADAAAGRLPAGAT